MGICFGGEWRGVGEVEGAKGKGGEREGGGRKWKGGKWRGGEVEGGRGEHAECVAYLQASRSSTAMNQNVELALVHIWHQV